MSEEKTSEKKSQANIEITGFASGADASQFGGNLRQTLFNEELPVGSNPTENTEAMKALQRGTTAALSNLEKNVQMTAFEAGSIPPTAGAGGAVTQSVAAYTLNSSKQQKDEKMDYKKYQRISRLQPGMTKMKIDEDELLVTVNNNCLTVQWFDSEYHSKTLTQEESADIIPLLPSINEKSQDIILIKKIFSMCIPTLQHSQEKNTPVLEQKMPKISIEVMGKGSTATNPIINSTQAHTLIYNNQYVQHPYVSPREILHDIWYVPSETTYFVGRQRLLKNIEAYFKQEENQQQSMYVVCHGLGGVGKTQLVVKYIWQHYQEYKGVCYFSAESKERLIEDYIKLGDEFSLFDDSQKKLLPEKRAAIIKGWFENSRRGGWLLVYDNASKYDDIMELLPTKGGKILITSRHTEWPGKKIHVEVFAEDEAREYVKTITETTHGSADIDELIKTLGGLPLALAQACAYIKKDGITVEHYLSLYQKIKNELLDYGVLPPGDQHECVMITWNITLTKMRFECPNSVELMYFSAFFHNEYIPQYMLEFLFSAENEALLEFTCGKAKITANHYSMITVDNEKKYFSMHCMVQEVIKIQLQKDKKLEDYLRKSITALLKAYPLKREENKYIKLKRELRIHLQEALKNKDYFRSVTSTVDENEIDGAQLELLLAYLNNAYSNVGDPQKSKELLERALTVEKEHYGKDHYRIVHTLVNLGIAYGKLEEAKKSKELFELALSIFEKKYGKDHYKVANILTNLGGAYGDLGDLQKKKELLERALNIKEERYGKDNYKVAITLGSLGSTYGALGDAKKMKKLLKRALSIFEKKYGKDHHKIAMALISLGEAYNYLGAAQKSKKLFERALEIEEEYYGKENYELASVLMNLANAYLNLGDTSNSIKFLERVLEIEEKYCGKDHHSVAKVLNNLGQAYGTLGDYQKSKKFLENALSIKEKYYGRDHYQVASTLSNLGTAYGALGDMEKGKNFLERSLTIEEKHYGKDHYQVAPTLMRLGHAYSVSGDTPKGKDLLERALSVFEAHYDKEHYKIAACLVMLGDAYYNLGNWQKTKELFQRALFIFEKKFGSHHHNTQICRKKLEVLNSSEEEEERQIQLALAINFEENNRSDYMKMVLDNSLQYLSSVGIWRNSSEKILNNVEMKETGMEAKECVPSNFQKSAFPTEITVVLSPELLDNWGKLRYESSSQEFIIRLDNRSLQTAKLVSKSWRRLVNHKLENDKCTTDKASNTSKSYGSYLEHVSKTEAVKISSFFEDKSEKNCMSKISGFLQAGGDPNAIDVNGNSLLILASGSRGYSSIMQFLLDNGANINHVNNKGETALHIAVGRQTLFDDYLISKRQAKARILLERGADPNLSDKESNTPLSLAEKHNYVGIIELLSKTTENVVSVNKPGGQKN